MVTVTVARNNPAIRAFHTQWCRPGKIGEVALVSAVRKFLITLNTLIRDQALGSHCCMVFLNPRSQRNVPLYWPL